MLEDGFHTLGWAVSRDGIGATSLPRGPGIRDGTTRVATNADTAGKDHGINAGKADADSVASMPLGRVDEETVANIGTVVGGEERKIVPGTAVQGMTRSHDQEKLDNQPEDVGRACQSATDDHRATVYPMAETICQACKIPGDAKPYREASSRDGSVW